MKYLRKYNETSKLVNRHATIREMQFWMQEREEISDIFVDILDEGFIIDDVHVGYSLDISPKKWVNSIHYFTGNTFHSLSIKFISKYKDSFGVVPKYDLSILEVMSNCITHFENYYQVTLESIYTLGLPTLLKIGVNRDLESETVIHNWFNSTDTIRHIVNSEDLNVNKFMLERFDLNFYLGKKVT